MRERIILASASPRRRALLRQIGIEADIIPSRMEENIADSAPETVVKSLALSKALEVARSCGDGCVVIGADTVVAVDGEILGKPSDPEDAIRMVTKLQGRGHQVYTGVALLRIMDGITKSRVFAERTDVSVYPMDPEEVQVYVSSGESMDKAGAYGIQGRFAAYIEGIRGDYNNVVGLPAGRVFQELKVLLKEDEQDD